MAENSNANANASPGPSDGLVIEQVHLDGINISLAQYHSAEAETLLLKYRHVETLIGEYTHHLSEGTFCEDLLREFLRKVIPRKFSVDTGFIRGRPIEIGGKSRYVSHQLDIIIHDTTEYSPLFRSEDFVVVLPDAVVAVIEVKKCLTSGELRTALEKLAVARALTYSCQPTRYISSTERGFFTGIVAFTSDDQLRPATKPFSDTYANRLTEIVQQIPPMHSVPDIIAVVDQEILNREFTANVTDPFSVLHRSSYFNGVNMACQILLFSLMAEMKVKEVIGGTWLRYSFPPDHGGIRVLRFENPGFILPL